MIFNKLTFNRIILLVYIFAFVYLATAIITSDANKLLISILLGSITYSYLLVTLWQRNRLVPIKGSCKILMHDEFVECIYENGTKQEIQWLDIRKITLKSIHSKENSTTSEVWLRLHSYPWRNVISIPLRATDFEALYNRLAKLEGFKKNKLNKIMRSEKAITMTAWQKKD
jgi:hypothetical protein